MSLNLSASQMRVHLFIPGILKNKRIEDAPVEITAFREADFIPVFIH